MFSKSPAYAWNWLLPMPVPAYILGKSRRGCPLEVPRRIPGKWLARSLLSSTNEVPAKPYAQCGKSSAQHRHEMLDLFVHFRVR